MARNTHQRPCPDLERLRIEAGLTLRALALRAGLSPGTVRKAELGTVPYPHAQKAIAAALSEALGRPLDHLDLWVLIEENGEAA